MKTRWNFAVGALALPLVLFSGLARAQNAATPPRTVYLYSAALGTAGGNLGAAKTAPWGNGLAAISRDMNYEGAPVLGVTTRNFQEGVRFDLAAPIDIEGFRANGFLRLRLRFRDTAPAVPEGAVEGEGGPPFDMEADPRARRRERRRQRREAAPLLKPAWKGAAQFGGALPPLGGEGFEGEMNPDGTPLEAPLPAQQTNITELGITLLRDNGVTMGRIPVNLETSTPDEEGWRLFVLPIKDLVSTADASGPVRSAILTSDEEDSFYLAQAAFVIESGQITVSIRRPEDPPGTQVAEVEFKPGAVTLIADVEAGAADPAVEWNFDADNVGNLPLTVLTKPNAPNPALGELPFGEGELGGEFPVGGQAPVPAGPRLDARGLTATFTYPNEEQNYRVEVTVRDRSGQKQPVKASILVKVRG